MICLLFIFLQLFFSLLLDPGFKSDKVFEFLNFRSLYNVLNLINSPFTNQNEYSFNEL